VIFDMIFHRLLASRSIVAAGTLLCVVPLSTTTARADVKIVSETTVTGLPDTLRTGSDTGNIDPKKPIASTVYLKGEKRRTETPVQTTIYDCASDTVYTLNTTDKTYTVSTLAKSVAADTAGSNPLLSLLKIETSGVALTPQKLVKNIAGKSASSYTFGMTLKMRPADPSLSEMIPNLVTTIKGEQWVSESIAAPAACERMAKSSFMNALPIPTALAGTGLKTLSEKMALIKGTPLSSRIEVTIKPGDGKAPDVNVLPIPKDPIIVVSEVKSISEDTLADSLFTVPADYKKVAVDTKSVTPVSAPR
jgi:hypothetical protein